MANRQEQQLLGYLLGALEDSERQRLGEQLRHSAALRRRLARVRRSLRPLAPARHEHAPPPGLAARTCQLVAQHRQQQAAIEPPRREPRAPAMSPVQTPPVAASSWGWADLAVAVGIAAATFLLLFPAIANSRFNAQLAQCQENLRQMGTALAQYGQRHQGVLPQVAGQDRLASGTCAPLLLLEEGFLTEPARLICPASRAPAEGRFAAAWPAGLFASRSPPAPARPLIALAEPYRFPLGPAEDGWYALTTSPAHPLLAIVAEPSSGPWAACLSVNHGGRGQNVLFVKQGRVAYFPSSPRPNEPALGLGLVERGDVTLPSFLAP